MKMPELLSCPFCGGLKEIRVHENKTPPAMNRSPNVISCDITHWCKCGSLPRGAIKITGRDKAEAVIAWNTRTDLVAPLVEALREIREIYAGMEGFIAETCPEGYLQQIVGQMAAVSMEALAAFERVRQGSAPFPDDNQKDDSVMFCDISATKIKISPPEDAAFEQPSQPDAGDKEKEK